MCDGLSRKEARAALTEHFANPAATEELNDAPRIWLDKGASRPMESTDAVDGLLEEVYGFAE